MTLTLVLFVLGAILIALGVWIASELYLGPYGGLDGLKAYNQLQKEIADLLHYYEENYKVTKEMLEQRKRQGYMTTSDPNLARIESLVRFEHWLTKQRGRVIPEQFAEASKILLGKVRKFKKSSGLEELNAPAFYSFPNQMKLDIITNDEWLAEEQQELNETLASVS